MHPVSTLPVPNARAQAGGSHLSLGGWVSGRAWDPSGVFERFTERSRHVVVVAQEEARALRHDYIGTEHILLGLLGEEGSTASRVLESPGITVERVRSEVLRIVSPGEEATIGQLPFTPRAKKVLELALTCDEATSRLLASLGVDVMAVRATLERASSPPDRPPALGVV